MGGTDQTASTTRATGPRPGAAPAHRGVAFGLRISGRFPAPGLWTGVGAAAMRRAMLELVSPLALERSWPEREAERLLRLSTGVDGPDLVVETHPERGHLVRAEGFGSYLIARDGRRILLAAGRVEDWRWQRLLTAQALPIAALAQGLGLLHASAVELDGRILAFAGASSAGKTTLAARLVLAGATFLSDDVLALERVGDEVIAHPGPALMNLRRSGAGTFDTGERARLGAELGRDPGATRLRVARKAEASPLNAIYLLRPSRSRKAGARVERLGRSANSQLLGAAFGTAIRTPARLVRHLDLCAHLAERVPVFSLATPTQVPPDALAETVLRHAGGSAP
jgi:hypothetical protein